ncbi:hypothetical protein M407DRAFT_106199 [Tulasnella calospora MUT 4182]|uniref:Uncharacterized protein n=1 Tax=Tulasnella calospora MUT 4182 TaxID=1051891 RepID=A0A0C3Q4M6_9AGAM|nr:hypothetical protein M407DRAFT_106199 [Tulasnella calospora MUT 4182]
MVCRTMIRIYVRSKLTRLQGKRLASTASTPSSRCSGQIIGHRYVRRDNTTLRKHHERNTPLIADPRPSCNSKSHTSVSDQVHR